MSSSRNRFLLQGAQKKLHKELSPTPKVGPNSPLNTASKKRHISRLHSVLQAQRAPNAEAGVLCLPRQDKAENPIHSQASARHKAGCWA